MKGRTPTAEEKRHLDKVSNLGCIVCRLQGFPGVPAEIHHVHGKTRREREEFRGSHFYVLPLCYSHHREGNDREPISRHPYKKRFVQTYGTEEYLLEVVESLIEQA